MFLTHSDTGSIVSTFSVWVLVGNQFLNTSRIGIQVLCQPSKIIKKAVKNLCESELSRIVLFMVKGLLQNQKKASTDRNGDQHGLQFTQNFVPGLLFN